VLLGKNLKYDWQSNLAAQQRHAADAAKRRG
jgi:hypothetical protein